MRHFSTRLMLALASIGTILAVAQAQPVNNGPFSTTGGAKNITAFATADDFTMGVGSFNSIRFWAVDGTDSLSRFSGTLSWFIHSNGAGIPGAVVASGTSSNVLVTDTGQTLTGSSIFQLDFNTPTTTLTTGATYWLRLKENLPDTPDNGGPVFWVDRSIQTGQPYKIDVNEVNPTTWDAEPNTTTDLAFQLNRASVTIPSTAAPEPGSLALALPLLVGTAVTLRRRKRS